MYNVYYVNSESFMVHTENFQTFKEVSDFGLTLQEGSILEITNDTPLKISDPSIENDDAHGSVMVVRVLVRLDRLDDDARPHRGLGVPAVAGR